MIAAMDWASPPSSRARIYADDAVGSAANTTITIVTDATCPLITQSIEARPGTINNLIIDETKKAPEIFCSAYICTPAPTDNRPRGKAVALRSSNIDTSRSGKPQPK